MKCDPKPDYHCVCVCVPVSVCQLPKSGQRWFGGTFSGVQSTQELGKDTVDCGLEDEKTTGLLDHQGNKLTARTSADPDVSTSDVCVIYDQQ